MNTGQWPWSVSMQVKRAILPKLTLRVTETALPGQASPPCLRVPFQSCGLEVCVCVGGGFIKGGGAPYTGLFLLPASLSLEVSVGKATTIYAVNGSEILLPCTFSSCFGFYDLQFSWSYNSSDTFKIVSSGGMDRTLQPLLPSLPPHPCPPFPALVPSGPAPL